MGELPDRQSPEIVDGQAMLSYYSKDAGETFVKFLQNPASSYSRGVLAPGESTEISDEELFASLWAGLTGDERAKILENADTAEVEIVEAIGADADSDAGRALLARNADEVSSLTAGLEFTAKLKDRLKGKKVPLSYAGAGIEENTFAGTEVPADLAIQKLFAENDWPGASAVLDYLDMKSFKEDLKTSWDSFAALTDFQTEEGRSAERSSSSSSSKSGASYSSPITENLGGRLRNGAVLVESGSGSAYLVGTYGHAGIFSSERYAKGGSNDYVHSVYTAQPNKTAYYDTDIRPDRPGYACIDTLRMYTRQKMFAAIEPINYTQARAVDAVNYAKTIFYDPRSVYFLPFAEAIRIGNSSHNLTNENTYCSKVAYVSWRKAGINLDSDYIFGNLVAPDDLYFSAYDRYRVINIKILFWTVYSKREKVYSAVSRIRLAMSR
jgi:hypothetical protein